MVGPARAPVVRLLCYPHAVRGLVGERVLLVPVDHLRDDRGVSIGLELRVGIPDRGRDSLTKDDTERGVVRSPVIALARTVCVQFAALGHLDRLLGRCHESSVWIDLSAGDDMWGDVKPCRWGVGDELRWIGRQAARAGRDYDQEDVLLVGVQRDNRSV